jgi:hypothetical protein
VIGFAPQTRGTRQARVRLLTNLPPTFEATPRDTSTFDIDVTAVGVPTGLLYVEGPTTIDSSRIGAEICRPVTIWNNGQEPLTINSATISGPEASEFTITGASFPLTIAAEGSVVVNVCATPTARGLRNASITIDAASNGQTSSVNLPLEVFGQLACAQSSTNIAFENEIIHVGEMSTAQITINNCGDVPATFTAAVTGNGYSLVTPPVSGFIEAGGNHTYEVRFLPTMMSPLPGMLTVTSEGINDINVSLAGTGGDVMLSIPNGTAPITAVGATSQAFEVNVTNSGNMDWTPGEPVISNTEFAYVAGSGAATIPAGTSATYRFTFTPAEGGNRTATVTFPASSPMSAVSFVLNGEGQVASVRPVASNGYSLGQNYPNPFAGQSVITFTMAEAGDAQIIISDITGNVVTTVANQFFGKGENKVTFDAANLTSGTYFYELVATGVRLQRSMLLQK